MRDADDPASRCNLGDIPDGLEPARPSAQPRSASRNRQARCEEPNRLHGFLAIVAMLVFGTVGLLVVFALLSARAAAEPIKLPRVCIALAEDYGMTVPGGVMERSEIERHLDSSQVIAVGILIPKVRRCRNAIKTELKK